MAEESGAAGPNKSGGGRSVSYPFITLEEAVSRAKVLWENEGKNLAFVSAAVKHWGYADKSSGGRQTVAALKSYGLVQDEGSSDGRQIKLTERALDILLDPDEARKKKALREAVTLPRIYNELLTKWSASALPSDLTIAAYLLREKDFNRNTVQDFIKDFRANVAYAGLAVSDNIPPKGQPEPLADNTPAAVKIGSSVQWEPNGILQFTEPKRVTGFSDDKEYLFVEGSLTGIPVNEVTVMPEAAVNIPAIPPATPTPVRTAPVGSRQDTFSLDEGVAVLQWPASLSSQSFEDFESWIQLQLKKIKRSVAN